MSPIEQGQRVGEGSTAIQGGRDVTVQHGMSPEQMKEVLTAVANQFPALVAVARDTVDARISEFEERVLHVFSPGGEGRSTAFADPDFLYVLKQSQHAYLRSGDEGVRDTLVDLIARRSCETTRNRLSLTLNEAVEKAAVLTKNEFAALSLSYLVGMTLHRGMRSMEQFASFVRDLMLPLLPDISREAASFQYLVAQSCGTIAPLGHANFISLIRGNYAGLFSRGYTRDQVVACLSEANKSLALELIAPCLNDPTKIQMVFLNRQELDDYKYADRLSTEEKNALWALIDSTTMNGDDLGKHIEKSLPEIRELIDIWDKTPLCRLNLTTIGIAIGHSNLTRLGKFKADLAIWIR